MAAKHCSFVITDPSLPGGQFVFGGFGLVKNRTTIIKDDQGHFIDSMMDDEGEFCCGWRAACWWCL